ncbi:MULTISPECIES: 50S ribosomal protein L11 methyltransferase [Prochlorococcus]|uniref:Ribosomal protein L11 methyltransferase n=1 Tax=Prochlorococcus marinus (strain SARG / CCMP1375 / SS120) TaxID=167539 RepID=PRMA_PROMA|nr:MULTISPECIES: 50S ribosomal protein L11 methyltransferase [Prochlorococcus]Q7VAM5.1 RecName: Full=Ribosomal protein L11 methyltransferase; Short=L11 Mtase [Prochlorococcus marinus subsp. marinus str. CCMP1375]AAQ00479.1 Ribosomal protein L11 methylase [Prochlorococcus marinus subsp. marinus str. CCMP1375]KGG14360.1 Ribosomal protein L11 methyltransferase [Prochlorococcus marinus str. LG]KGG22066.1 Ribosomal protein L11 methyltransferase [Prochlorococcus marinus str. SS2]KGG24616.1 Ribosomal
MIQSTEFFWWKFELVFPPDVEESFLWFLNMAGIKSYAIERSPDNLQDQTLMVWLPSHEWLKKDREEFENSLLALNKAFREDVLNTKWEKIIDEDWSSSWKKFWKADPVGSKILILPSWLELPDIYSNRIVIKLDPGSAFGTGSHPTTRLCLEDLERNPPLGKKVVDIGCGSGVLGIAAIKLGAKEVRAIDIDSLAVRATSENIVLNNLSQKQLSVSLGSIENLANQLNPLSADLLICNTLSPVIKELAPYFFKLTHSYSRLCLSGLLVAQVEDITNFLSILGWELIDSYSSDNWALIRLCRNHP